MNYDLLPFKAQEICEQQGWNDQTLVDILLQFIQVNVPKSTETLTYFFQTTADLENAPPLWNPENSWQEHPNYSSSDWIHEVANGYTRLGYIDWVNAQIELNQET